MVTIEDFRELHKFLTSLKLRRWLIEIDDYDTIFTLTDWYEKIFCDIDLPESRNKIELKLCEIKKRLCEFCNKQNPDDPNIKICYKCKTVRPIEDFKRKNSPDIQVTCCYCRAYQEKYSNRRAN